MKEMTRKEFLKLTGASTALLAMSHIIPTSAYADTSKIDAPSAGMYISEVVDLSGLSPVEQEKILTERNIPYDSTITYEKIVVERLNCTPFVRQYGILFRKWGVFVCQRDNESTTERRR